MSDAEREPGIVEWLTQDSCRRNVVGQKQPCVYQLHRYQSINQLGNLYKSPPQIQSKVTTHSLY